LAVGVLLNTNTNPKIKIVVLITWGVSLMKAAEVAEQRKKYSSYESTEKEYKFKSYGYRKDKQSISYGKIVEKINTKIQATYEHGADITWSIENKKKFDFDTV